SDRIIGILAAKSRRAERGESPVAEHLLLTRYSPERVARGEMLTVEDVREILSVPLLGIIPESESVLRASNTGTPVIFDQQSPAGRGGPVGGPAARCRGEAGEMRLASPGRRTPPRPLLGRAGGAAWASSAFFPPAAKPPAPASPRSGSRSFLRMSVPVAALPISF